MPADLAAKTARSGTAGRGGARRALTAAWEPTQANLRVIALAGVVATAGSIVTGAAVRLSQSGLGCPDWPNCTGRSLVAASSRQSTLLHAWVEFGNRLFVTLVMAVSVVVLVAAWRFRPGEPALSPGGRTRRWLVGLAAVQPAGVVLQAVLGGIVVLTNLNPAMVSIHFIASIAILAAAVALYVMLAAPAASPGAAIRADLRWLSAGLVAAAGVMLAAGTVVTGTGPLAGASSVARYRLPLEGVTQMHADIGWLLAGLTIAMVIALRAAAPPPAAARLGWLLLGLIAAQGAIGYSQYFSGLPAGLVWVHVLGATLVWIVTLLLFFALHPDVLPAVRARAQAWPAGPGSPEPGGTGRGGAGPGTGG